MADISVLHLLAPAAVGGLETVVPALALGARGTRVKARVAAVVPCGETEHPFFRPFHESGIETFAIQVPSRGYLQERVAVARLCRALRPHVVHTHGYRADVLDAGVPRSLGIPIVSTVHGFGARTRLNRVYHWLQRRALRRFDAVIAVSRMLGEDLAASGVRRDRLHCIQNGWRPEGPLVDRTTAARMLGLEPNGFRIGWVGRLSHEKGPDILVDALGRLADQPLHASFVGAGPMREELEQRSTTLRIRHRIHWHGTVPSVGRLLPAFDVLLLTSRAEGTPMVLLEAIAAGVPVVAARVGGIPDVVSPAEALLVPGGDAGAVAAAIREVMGNPGAAARRATAARARLSREFGYADWLGRYEAVYDAVAAMPPRTTRSNDVIRSR